jgi:hypothetical protein
MLGGVITAPGLAVAGVIPAPGKDGPTDRTVGTGDAPAGVTDPDLPQPPATIMANITSISTRDHRMTVGRTTTTAGSPTRMRFPTCNCPGLG